MNTSLKLLAISCVLALVPVTPASAQHDAHAQDQVPSCTAEHAAMGHCTMPETHQHHPQPRVEADADDSACTAEHAAMGHCTMPGAQQHNAVPAAGAGDRACTAEHAAMGHCTLQPAPTEPREPIPEVTHADRAAAFPHLHTDHDHGRAFHWRLRFNRFEAWDADHGTGQAWSGNLWLGGDVNSLLLKSSGERSGGRTGSANVEALYSRAVTPWWELVAGAKHEFQPDGRTWGAIGVQGLAPYLFELSAMAYAADSGQVQLKVEAEYEVLLTNRLILQPLVEVTASLEDEPEYGIGSGLGKLEAGLRLRYEFNRRFAPYIGVAHERVLGNSADLARASGGHLRDTRFVAGVRFWF